MREDKGLSLERQAALMKGCTSSFRVVARDQIQEVMPFSVLIIVDWVINGQHDGPHWIQVLPEIGVSHEAHSR